MTNNSKKPNLETKNIRFKAYIGGVEVPFTSLSMQAFPNGFTFSIAIPPITEDLKLNPGTYGYIKYSYQSDAKGFVLLCDGYMVSDTPYANKGVYSRQLIFRDMFSALRFFYIDNSLLNTTSKNKLEEGLSFVFGDSKETVDAKKAKTDTYNTMLNKLKADGLDIIGKHDVSFDKDNLLHNIASLALMGSNIKQEKTEIYSIDTSTKEGRAEKKLASFKWSVNNYMHERSMKALGLDGDDAESGGNVRRLILSLAKLINTKVITAEGDNSVIKTPFRDIFALSKRIIINPLGELKMTPYAFIATFQGLSRLSMEMMFSHGGIVDFITLYNRVVGATGLQSITVPGMTKGQVVLMPNTPYLPVLKNNIMGTSFDSISIDSENDIPTTHAVAVYQLTASTYATEQPFNGVASYDESSFIKRLTHVTKNPLEYLYAEQKTRDEAVKSDKRMMKSLEAIAQNQLNIEALSRSSLTITTSMPKLDVVPGFGFKLLIDKSQPMYGKVESVSINVSTDSIAQTITLSNVFIGKDKEKNPYLGNYAIAVFDNIGLYKAKSARDQINLAKKHIEEGRYGKIETTGGAKHSAQISAIKASWVKEGGPYFGNPTRYKSTIRSKE